MSEFRASDGDGGRPVDNDGNAGGRATVRTATGAVPAPPRVDAPPTIPERSATTNAAPRRRSLVRIVFRWLVGSIVALSIIFAGLIVAYRFVDPPVSALMLLQKAGGTTTTQTWLPINRISAQLVRAVIMSEDAGFCRHIGVDFKELEAAFEQAQDGVVRGGSTISMQTAKNLFLWPQRSYVRKAIEIPLTLAMEAVWPKARMLEIYLNIAEWGPGIFGAEAAAQYHFAKSASRLSEQEAALLAVALPAPLIREPGNPSALLARMGQTIVGRMRASARHTTCVLPALKTG